MSALHSLDPNSTPVPVPHPLLLCNDADVIGTPFFCYDFVEGRFFKSPRLDGVRCVWVGVRCVWVGVRCVCVCVGGC
jgi:hypothetical protein